MADGDSRRDLEIVLFYFYSGNSSREHFASSCRQNRHNPLVPVHPFFQLNKAFPGLRVPVISEQNNCIPCAKQKTEHYKISSASRSTRTLPATYIYTVLP